MAMRTPTAHRSTVSIEYVRARNEDRAEYAYSLFLWTKRQLMTATRTAEKLAFRSLREYAVKMLNCRFAANPDEDVRFRCGCLLCSGCRWERLTKPVRDRYGTDLDRHDKAERLGLLTLTIPNPPVGALLSGIRLLNEAMKAVWPTIKRLTGATALLRLHEVKLNFHRAGRLSWHPHCHCFVFFPPGTTADQAGTFEGIIKDWVALTGACRDGQDYTAWGRNERKTSGPAGAAGPGYVFKEPCISAASWTEGDTDALAMCRALLDLFSLRGADNRVKLVQLLGEI